MPQLRHNMLQAYYEHYNVYALSYNYICKYIFIVQWNPRTMFRGHQCFKLYCIYNICYNYATTPWVHGHEIIQGKTLLYKLQPQHNCLYANTVMPQLRHTMLQAYYEHYNVYALRYNYICKYIFIVQWNPRTMFRGHQCFKLYCICCILYINILVIHWKRVL